MEWKKIIKEQLAPLELSLMADEVLKKFEEYKKEYPEPVAYVLAMADFLIYYKQPPLVDASFIDDEATLLKALGDRIRPATGHPYDELLKRGLYTCAAEYAYESERATLLVTRSGTYILA